MARLDNATWEAFGARRCLELAERDGFEGKDFFFGPLPEVPAQAAGGGGGQAGLAGLAGGLATGWRLPGPQLVCKLAKWQRCGSFHSSKWYRGPTLAAASVEAKDEDVFVMLLDPSRAEGLDLSFLTHLFLLEPIKDAARLEQVVFRRRFT